MMGPAFGMASGESADGGEAMTLPATADVVIAGGGVMGLSTAYHLLKKQPGLRVVVL